MPAYERGSMWYEGDFDDFEGALIRPEEEPPVFGDEGQREEDEEEEEEVKWYQYPIYQYPYEEEGEE